MARSRPLDYLAFGLLLLLCSEVNAQGWVVPKQPSAPFVSPDQAMVDRLLDYMDNKENACQDFQKYAGGRYTDKHEEDDYSELLGEVEQKVNDRFISLFGALKDRVFLDESSAEAKVSRFYQTCLNARNKTRFAKHYLELVAPDRGLTWPDFSPGGSSWPKNRFQWMQTLANLRRFGFDNLLIRVNVELDYVDASKYMITIEKPTYDDSLNRLWTLGRTRSTLLKLGLTGTRSYELSESLMRLERALRKLAKVEIEPNDDLSLQELEQQNGLAWRQYLQTVFGRSFPASQQVQIMNVDYFVELEKLLRTYDSDVIATYLMLRFIGFLDKVTGSMAGSDEQACVKNTRVIMDIGSNFLYESRFFDVYRQQQYDTEIQKIFNAVRTTLLARIETNRLGLTARQRNYVKEKVESIYINVGNMPKGQDHRTFANNFYRDLQLDQNNDFGDAVLKALEVRAHRVLDLLNGPAIKGDNYYYIDNYPPPSNPEPKHSKRDNMIFLPYDLLQEPYFVPESHDVFKVSGLGFMIAQELMNVLDVGYIFYDAEGNPSEVLAKLSENTKFVEGTNCLNEKSTDYLNQRVTDVMALKLIYDAYFGPGSKFNQQQPNITNIPLQQLFFLNYAQNLIGDEEYVDFVGADTDKVRLHVTLENLPGFAAAFNCPMTPSNLNLRVKCEVW